MVIWKETSERCRDECAAAHLPMESSRIVLVKEEVIDIRRANEKRRRAARTPAEKMRDNEKTKRWRKDNKEYVKAFDHLRHANKVPNYTKQ
jgi:hypothetical protein